MPFTADLNPKSGKSMDLMDMIKMEDYYGRRAAKPAAKPSNMVKSSADDKGVEFRFNSNQNANDTTG
jgi:hypothetical protein